MVPTGWITPRGRGITDAADANFLEHASWVQRAAHGMTVDDDGTLAVIDSGLPCDTFNLVCRARLSDARADSRVRAALDHFRGVRRPFSWWVSPADRPRSIGEWLQAAGLERAESELAMAADLSRIAAPPPIEGLSIERASSPEVLEHYARILASLWDPPDADLVTFYRRAAPRLLSPGSPMACYVARLDGEAVGTVEATEGGGVVGLYNIATLPEYRRRGIGTALTVHPLREATRRGARAAVLQASADGVGIYQRVGFRSFGTITEYKPPASWFPEA